MDSVVPDPSVSIKPLSIFNYRAEDWPGLQGRWLLALGIRP